MRVGDGRRFLARDERQWDVIVLDAFFADTIPFHLVTAEFMELVEQRLAPGGVVDGPLPTHYEPVESVVDNALYSIQANPTVERIPGPWNRENPSRSEVFPFQVTTYRLTEHHTAGGMSRTLPYLSELQPEFFVEVSPELAARVTDGGVFRRGLWGPPGNVNPPRLWSAYPEITSARHAASDHAAVWLDLDL